MGHRVNTFLSEFFVVLTKGHAMAHPTGGSRPTYTTSRDANHGPVPGNASSSTASCSVPVAAVWARRIASGLDVATAGFRRFGAPTTVRLAVLGIADAWVHDPDERLYELLVAVIDECAAVCGPDAVTNTGRRRHVDILAKAR
jgi:hypothetical protein